MKYQLVITVNGIMLGIVVEGFDSLSAHIDDAMATEGFTRYEVLPAG